MLGGRKRAGREVRQRARNEKRGENDKETRMEDATMECGKCNTAMEQGFVVDYTADKRRRVAEWVEGEPKPSFWQGLDVSRAGQIPIVAYRCQVCGHLEFFARTNE